MNQSIDILRFLGIKYGYYPKDPMAAYKVDQIMATNADNFSYRTPFFKQEKADEQVVKESVEVFNKLCNSLSKNLGQCRFFGGS